MSRIGNIFNPLTWLLVLLPAVFITGCGDEEDGVTSDVDGSYPVSSAGVMEADRDDRGTSGFALLNAFSTTTDADNSLTYAQMIKTVYGADDRGPLCTMARTVQLVTKVDDKGNMYPDGNGQMPDYIERATGSINKPTLHADLYKKLSARVVVTTTSAHSRDANNASIFQIAQGSRVCSDTPINAERRETSQANNELSQITLVTKTSVKRRSLTVGRAIDQPVITQSAP